MRPGEWFGDQHDFFSVAGAEAFVSLFRSVTNDDNGKLGEFRVVPHHVKKRLAHVIYGAVEDQRVRELLQEQLDNGICKSGSEDFKAAIAQSEGKKLGDLRRIVDEQDARQPIATSRRSCRAISASCPRPAPDPKPKRARPPCNRRGGRFALARPTPR